MRTNEIAGYKTTIEVDGFEGHGGLPEAVYKDARRAGALLVNTIGYASFLREKQGITTPHKVTFTITICAIPNEEAEKMEREMASLDIIAALIGALE